MDELQRRELKDNLGSDDPEGDIPVLLQAVLARNPNVFREKSMQNRYGVQSGMMMPQYKLSQNSMHGSPASSNYQQTTISHSPSSRFVPPQSSSGNRFMAPQNSPVPSPYAPQSPAGYLPYSHPPSYTPHPQMQQELLENAYIRVHIILLSASVSSPIVSGGMRNIHENKITSQLGSSTNHHPDNTRHGSSEDYLHMVHRISSEDGDSSIRNTASFSLRSPQSVCSPAGSDGTPKGSRPPLILPSQPPPYSSPRDVPPDILLDSPERKQKKQKKMKLVKDEKDQTEKAAMYDIISSPSKDSTKLTLRLSRIRSSDMDQQDDMLSGLENSNASEGDISFNVQYPGQTSKTPVTPQDINRPLNAAQCLPQHEQTAFLQAQQVPVLQPNTSVSAKQPQNPLVQTHPQVSQHGTITPYDEVELDALAEIERIERESAIERERFSKEVQDKDKPLKKRKQDSFPQEAGGATGGNKPASQDTNSAGNGSRPALMVSIDLQQAGRADSQAVLTQDLDIIKKPEEIKQCNDGSLFVAQDDVIGVLKLKTENFPETLRKKSDSEGIKMEVQHNENKQTGIQQNEGKRIEIKHCESKQAEVKHESKHENRQVDVKQNEGKQNNGKQEIRQRPETPKQKNEVRPDTPKQKNEGRPETPKQKNEGRPETPKHRHENRRDSNKSSLEKKLDISKYKMDMKSDPSRVKSERSDSLKQRPDGRSISDSVRRDHDGLKQKTEDRGESERYRGDPSKMRRPEYLRSSSKGEHDSKHIIRTDNTKAERLDRKHRHESGESRDKLSSGDQRSRPDSPRIKQESKLRTDRPSFKSQNSKDDRRTDGNKSKMDSSKAHGDSKAEFPSYLLGGRSGALKHFIIPKIKRDKDGNVMHEVRKSEFKGEPKNKVEKIGLVEDLNKGAKPVVVLQKLSLDDVQKFIKDREDKSRSSCFRSNKNKSSKSSKGSIDQSVLKELPPELLAEIESTMPLCERVKMNKRKRSTVNEKPKYAEISSDEDNDSEEAFEKMMDSSTFKRFSASVENILDNLEDMDFTAFGDDDEIPQELLLGKHQLSELGSESAKIKAMGIMDRLSTEKTVKVLNILEKNIQDGAKLSTLLNHNNDTEDEERLWRDLIMERVTKSADACLTAINIMTSPNMPKAVYIEDVIERVIQYTKFHLQNTLYPQYDPVYRLDPHGGGVLSSKAKRAKCSTHKQRVIVMLYNKICDIVSSLAELLEIQLLTDTTILQISSTGITPFFVENVSELQLCAIKLVTAVFSRYEKHRQLILEEIFTSLARLPTSKRSLRNFRCGSKQGEEDYRPLFENFVQDLLSTVNKPEWPAAELLLSLLGRLLVHQFSNKSTEMALRVASLDYLGTVAARLRKDAVTSKMDQGSIARILKQVSGGEDEIQQLQKALLDYLEENTETDASLVFSRKFYIAQWFRDTTMETEKAMKSQKDEDSSEGTHHSKEVETTGQIMHRAESRKKFLRNIIKTAPSQFSTLKINSDTVDYEDACLVVRYLASMRPFAQSFDIYLTQILRVLGENAIAVRTKAMKCLSEVVAVDPSILARLDMQRGVHGRLMDNSTSVREAAVELLGRFVLCRPQLAEQYYDMLIERILDTGISVRKRVIKILRDICIEQPTFPKITEMCVKMIRRVNDEEGIKKLVNETFQKLWFTPTPHNDKEAMTRKILNITDVVAACRDTGYDWFEQLLQNLLKSEEDASYKPVKKACTQLVDNLVEHILKYEESLADSDNKGVNSSRLVACITTLFLFSKIRPQLMVKHAMTMQPYLTTKCSNQNDFMVICNVAKILELVVPLMEHPSETFLATMEEDLMKLIIKYGMTVVQHCVSCLGAVVNKVTQNFKFVWACFNRYYGALSKLKSQHQEDPNSTILTANKPALLRSLFTVGALCRHFDFDQEDFKGNSKVNIKDKVLELLMYFTKHSDEEVQTKAIIGLGFAFIQHPSLMFEQEVKTLYNNILSDKNCSVNLKIQVLKNLQTYLQEEDTRMQQADREWKKVAKQEDLKEMGDISSGMSSSIMQLYLKQVLEAFFHTQSSVRHFALNVIALTLNQGLIHPVQCVPYLIAMGTDPEPSMRNKADQQLVEIDKKYAGFIHMKAVAGMKMSYQVQQAINTCRKDPVRGFRQDESSSALCSHLYSMIRGNRQHRRAFLISLLNLFDDTASMVKYKKEKKPSSDEESESESNSESESESEEEIHKSRKSRKRANSDSDTDEENDINAVMKCLPDNSAPLIEFANVSQGILLLLMLKQHLKNLCGFSDTKIQKYSPSESAKVYDKAINRKAGIHFHPKQTLDFLRSDMANSRLTEDVKRNIVKQYLDFKLLMEHLDPDEEEEDGEVSASTNARNKAITSLLGGGSPRNNAAETEEDESDGEDRGGGTSGSLRRSKRNSDSTELAAQMNESVDVMDVIAICCPKYKDRPQIARVVQKTSNGFSVQWMAGSYSGSWTEAKRRDGRKLVPWVDTIKESDIIYKKIALTSANKLTNKVVQTLRSLYAAKDGTSS
ncbi:Nipped-B-like protein, partial [Ophiophagus hannah]